MKLVFKVSEKGFKAAIQQGKEISANQTLEIAAETLTQEQREKLLANTLIDMDKGQMILARSGRRLQTVSSYVDGWTLEAVFAQIAAWEAEAAAEKEAHAAKEVEAAKERAERLAHNIEQLEAFKNNQTVKLKRLSGQWSDFFQSGHTSLVGVTLPMTEYFDSEEHLNIVTAEIERRKAEKEAERLAAVEALKTWAMQHGSELVRLRIEEGMNWRDMARTEWAQAQFGEGWGKWRDFIDSIEDKDPDGWLIQDATVEQIQELRAARDIFTSAKEVKLRRIKDSETNTHYDVLNVILVAPDGEDCDYLKVLSSK